MLSVLPMRHPTWWRMSRWRRENSKKNSMKLMWVWTITRTLHPCALTREDEQSYVHSQCRHTFTLLSPEKNWRRGGWVWSCCSTLFPHIKAISVLKASRINRALLTCTFTLTHTHTHTHVLVYNTCFHILTHSIPPPTTFTCTYPYSLSHVYIHSHMLQLSLVRMNSLSFKLRRWRS